jgi:hypothetical protein
MVLNDLAGQPIGQVTIEVNRERGLRLITVQVRLVNRIELLDAVLHQDGWWVPAYDIDEQYLGAHMAKFKSRDLNA